MARKSSAALAVAQMTVIRRLGPTRGLTDFQRNVWVTTVNSKPAEWFKDEHIPLLAEYVRHVETSAVLTREIDGFDTACLQDDEQLRRYQRLTTMRAREAGVINTLARSMRLTHQAIYEGKKAVTLDAQSSSSKPWAEDDAAAA